jgi:hypothetical protein
MTLRLPPKPGPGNLNRYRPNVTIARLADASLPRLIATLMGCRNKTCQRPNLLTVAKRSPTKKLHHLQLGAINADPPKIKQLANFFYI